MDEPDLTVRVAEMDNRIDVVHAAATHAYEKANMANNVSQLAISDSQNLKSSINTYQAVIDDLQRRVSDLEHKIELLTGPCVCEPLI